MKHLIPVIAVLLLSVASASAIVAPQQPAPPWFAAYAEDVEHLVKKYYPDATVVHGSRRIQFAHNTREFMVHEALKTGEWQDAHEVTGPDKGGVFGVVRMVDGPYAGAAMLPQSFDKRYYTEYVFAPHDARCDCHLYAHIRYPADFKSEFLNELKAMTEDFSAYVLR